MSLAIRVTLDDDASLALENLPKAVSRRIAHVALLKASRPMLAAIKGHIHDVSGLLRSGLRIRAPKGDRPGRVAVLIQSWTTREKFARQKPHHNVAAGRGEDRYRVYYAPMVEFGHRTAAAALADTLKPKALRGGGERVPPHPFMAPGFDEMQDAAATEIEELLAEGIDAEWTLH